mgnify:CR=1 FL=1
MNYIISDPEIMAGNPVIQGTRVPIAVILSLIKQGYTMQEIHKMYNWISVRKLKGAIDEITDLVATSFHAKSIL